MGAWGTAPWDNDAAADWFGDTLDPVAERIEKTLFAEEPHWDETRAALWLLRQLNRNYVYPVFSRDRHVERAVEVVDEMMASPYVLSWYGDDDRRAISDELYELREYFRKAARALS